jgi:arylsulfatase A-like enzyme
MASRRVRRRDFLKTLGLGVCGVAAARRAAWAEGRKRPNIVFVLVDDQRNDSLGCAGHPFIRTPNVDRLAEQGVRFENAFVTTSICMASRACIFTGMTERSHGYTGGPCTPVMTQDVDTSFPVLLRQAGYRTGFFGKQHVRFQEGQRRALGRMFDSCRVLGRNPYFKKTRDGTKRHVGEIIGDESVKFVKAQRKDRPFFLYMSFNISHAEDGDKRPGIGHFPWPRQEDGLYDDIDPPGPALSDPKYFDSLPRFLQTSLNRQRYFWRWDTPEKYRTNMRAYHRMLTGMDRIVGRTLAALKEKGLAEDTVVIYSADNGYYRGDRGLAGKWSHFEQSLRVPLIVHDPRRPDALRGRVVDNMALNIDIPATILDFAGLKSPPKYQGRTLTGILSDEVPKDWRTDFYCEHHMQHKAIPKWYGVRGRRYTYARYYEHDFEFLHDLDEDPNQLVNFVDDPGLRPILDRMRARAEEYVEAYTRSETVEFKREYSKGRSGNSRKRTRRK